MDTQSLTGKKVLYVEDDAFFADMMTEKLSAVGCKMSHAITGEQALEVLVKDRPDLIVLDIMLPGGMDGFAVLERIKQDEHSKDAPVVILSNLSSLEDVEKGMRLGAFKYLTKANVTPQEVVIALNEVLHALKL